MSSHEGNSRFVLPLQAQLRHRHSQDVRAYSPRTRSAARSGRPGAACGRERAAHRFSQDGKHMKTLLRLLAAAVLGVSLPAYALQDFDACVAPAIESGAGTVDSVREVPVQRDIHAFDPEVLEHSVRPLQAQELVVRLDAGALVVFGADERL